MNFISFHHKVEIFQRRGPIRHHKIQARLHELKRRRIPIELQGAVKQNVNRLLREGHIEKST